MGLLGDIFSSRSSSSTTNNQYTTNDVDVTDARVTTYNEAGGIQVLDGGRIITTTDNSNRSVTTTNTDNRDQSVTTTTTNTQVVDGGLTAAARAIAQDAIDAANRSTRQAVEAANAATEALRRGQEDALSRVTQAQRDAFGIAEDSIAAAKDLHEEGLNYGERIAEFFGGGYADLAGETIDAILQIAEKQTTRSDATIRGFANDLFTANQTSEERQYERLAQLGIVALIVIGVGFAFMRSR